MKLLLAFFLFLTAPYFCWAQQSSENTEEQSDSVLAGPIEILPEFPGGQKAMFDFLTRKFKIPKSVRKTSVDGTVVASFMVKSNGIVENIQCLESPHPDLCVELIRVLSLMPRWKAGTQNGIAVDVKYTIPLKIVINQPKPTRKESFKDNDPVYK